MRKLVLFDEQQADIEIISFHGVGIWQEAGKWHCLGKYYHQRITAFKLAKKAFLQIIKPVR